MRANLCRVEPVEINAGEHYLRAFRRDDRIDDVPALVEMRADPGIERCTAIGGATTAEGFVEAMTAGWENDRSWSWAVCDAVSAEVVAGIVFHEIDHDARSAEVSCWTHPGHRGQGVVPKALAATLGWVYGGAGMDRVVYRHPVSAQAARRVAEKCGFTPLESADHQDELLWSRLATDPLPERLP